MNSESESRLVDFPPSVWDKNAGSGGRVGPTWHRVHQMRCGRVRPQVSAQAGWALRHPAPTAMETTTINVGPQPSTTTAATQHLPALRLLQANAAHLKRIALVWQVGNYGELGRQLRQCDDYFDVDKPHLLAYFVGQGGVDLFVRILCEPSSPSPELTTSAPTARYRHLRQQNGQLVVVLNEVTRVLTELLICHPEMNWYLYHRYPGVVFRLLELLEIPTLCRSATSMLEHLISGVGPILEIVRTPQLMALLGHAKTNIVASVCRIVALLLVPGLALGQSLFLSRRLTYPESLLPVKRVQRVVDSNVLWLLQAPGMADRLIRLCEIKARGIRVQDGNRTMTLFAERPPSPASGEEPEDWDRANDEEEVGDYEESSSEWIDMPSAETPLDGVTRTTSFVEPGSAVASPLRVDPVAQVASGQSQLFHFYQAFRRQGVMEGPLHEILRQVIGIPSIGVPEPPSALLPVNAGLSPEMLQSAPEITIPSASGRRGDPSSVDDGAVPGATASYFGVGMDSILQEIVDEALLHPSHGAADNSSVDFSWLFGTADARQSWRLADLTLDPLYDDNRADLYFSSHSDPRAAFDAANKACLQALRSAHFPTSEDDTYQQELGRQNTVDSQSEILFVLNVMLSNFNFSDAWRELQRSKWIPRATKIYNAAFGLDENQPPMVELAPHIDLPKELRRLQRFQSAPVRPTDPTLSSLEGTSDIATVTSHDRFPESWRLPLSFFDMLGSDKEDFIADCTTLLQDTVDTVEDKNHQHGPDTIRKLELLRGIHEFWNVQDRLEASFLQDERLPQCARILAEKIARTFAACKEDSCVEATACHTLEGYLRCFSFSQRFNRCLAGSPQTTVSKILLCPILESRIYNATRVPGLSSSLKPNKRLDAVFALLAEAVRYHEDNLRTLCRYVRGDVPLLHLNAVHGNTNRVNSVVHSTDEEAVEAILKCPPLERQEDEAFGCTLLRRVYRYGSDTNLFVRSLIVSLTPGLRSQHNYVHKVFPLEKTAAVDILEDSPSRQADLITGHPIRFAQTRELSRQYTSALSERVAAGDHAGATELLVDSIVSLMHCTHRQPLAARSFPDIISADDIALLRGECSPLPPGPPPAWRVGLFDTGVDDTATLQELRELSDYILGEPHKLLYSMLCSLSAERMDTTARLCVVTSAMLVMMRHTQVAHGGDINAGIHDILERVRPLAQPSYDNWKANGASNTKDAMTCVCTCRTKGNRHFPPASSCRDVNHRCVTFVQVGMCHPPSPACLYYHRYGGCFFRNFFRLLCVWVSHYTACQRFVETLFFCTEIAFAEYKTVFLCLFRALPSYFMPAREELPV